MGQEPSATDVAFYASGNLGHSTRDLDKDLLLPVMILSLHKTMRSGFRTPSQVIVFTPPISKDWVLAQFGEFSKDIFNRLKDRRFGSTEGRIALAKAMGKCFAVMFVSPHLLQVPSEPPSWTCFGFTREDVIPDWMKSRLL